MATVKQADHSHAEAVRERLKLMANGKLIDPQTGLPYRVGDSLPLPAGADRSSSSAAGAQSIAAANTSRKGLTFQNTSDTEMRVTESGTPASGTTGYQILPGGRFTASTNKAISVYCASAGKTFAATEW